MQRFMELLLDVWREACRHIAIEESADRAFAIVRGKLPIADLSIRWLDVRRGCLDTVAWAGKAEDGRPTGRTTFRPAELELVLTWIRRGRVCCWPAADGVRERRMLTGRDDSDAVVVGPLATADEPTGVVIMTVRPGESFTALHLDVVTELLDPLSVALANDRDLRAINTHREAAEADRCSLLARLGRQAISEMIVGADGGLRAVMERVEQVARADVPVLVFGETGSGKEVIARAVHARSDRSAGPFMRVNCGAIPPELVDSELFGHERGSFTGAVGTRKGWFERADGGTLFLDEIGELPSAAQVRLLRVIQDGRFERVGGQRQHQVNVRIVAATHRDLQAMVRAGDFREDLWYRLAIFPIHLPPLRERPEDMAALAAHFAIRASRRFGLPALTPSLADIDLLSRYDWPGNIRELAAVIDRAAILGNGRCLEMGKALGVMSAYPESQDGQSSSRLSRVASLSEAEQEVDDLDTVVRRHVEFVLRKTRGQVDGRRGAARLLGINPHTLRARMRKLGIDWRRFRDQ